MKAGTSVGTERGKSTPGQTIVAYLILTHKDPKQVENLASRILALSPEAQIVVHHDLKADSSPWDGSPPERVHMVDRVQVEWGGWSIVEATLRMFRFAHDQLGAAWFVVLSGEHWPVVDLAAWERALASSGVDAFLPAQMLPRRLHFGLRDLDGNRFLARSLHRWIRIQRPKSDLVHKGLAGFSKISLRTHPLVKFEFSIRGDSWFIGTPRRRGPVKGWDLYKGSEWIACNARAASVLLNADPEVTDWFKRSHIPDESYVQSLVRRSGNLVVSNRDVTWVPPEPVVPTAGWMLLKRENLDTVLPSGVIFARKVDPARNPDVIAAIDDRVDALRHGGMVEAPVEATTDRSPAAP